MPPRSKTEKDVKGTLQGVSAEVGILKELENEIISLQDGDTKFFQHGDGKGETMLNKNGSKVTAVTIRYAKGMFGKRERQKVTLIILNSKGVVIDGWDI